MPKPARNKPTRKARAQPRKVNAPTLRFAHPYFTPIPPEQRPKDKVYGQRMLDHVQGTLHPIPPTKGDGLMTLADVIGEAASNQIAAANQISIHIAGDTGVPEIDRETRQVMVADAMAKDYDASKPETSPAFFLHLGDVIYGPNPDSYLDQFYRPYMHYPGKIVAIPGNHDGEMNAKMTAFQQYFCASAQTVPPIAGSIFRQTMNQPGVYRCLDAPFVHIIGLYSNSAENPGFISGPVIGQQQKQWLIRTLTTIKATRERGTRKALLVPTHHPPFSSGGHTGSTDMLNDIDDACTRVGIMYDVFFSGHAHSIQRYTRSLSFSGKTLEIPYVVSGCGGHGGQPVDLNTKIPGKNPIYDFAHQGWGYTKATITSKRLMITSYGVDWDGVHQVDASAFDIS